MTAPSSAKFPRMPHLPFSPGRNPDDERLKDTGHLLGRDLVLTEKVDGSNVCWTGEAIFARSHGGPPSHPSFDLAKAMWSGARHLIPHGTSVFGEWTYAAHSIPYDALPGFFLVFAVRDDEQGTWRSWEDTASLAKHLGVPTVPVLDRGAFATEAALQERVEELAPRPSAPGGAREGIVVRVAGPFVDFAAAMAKWVRAGHVQTREDWAHRPFRRNQLRP